MKNLLLSFVLFVFVASAAVAQPGGQGMPPQGMMPRMQFEGEEVYSGEDVVFHKIDDHTWVGTGHVMSNESLYLIEGSEKAILLDAGTSIKDLDKIVESITDKPVTLIATHVHPDHTGSAIDYWPEIYINAADMVNVASMMPNYPGEIKYLTDGEVLDLGGREIEVVFTPGHTPGSTSFIDKDAHYGFSGDSFGSGNLLLTTNYSTLIASCERMKAIMEKYDIEKLYPGHFMGGNFETLQRVTDMITLSEDVLSGKVKGQENPQGMLGLNMIISDYGVRINYSEASMK